MLLFSAAAIVLEALPYGAKLKFALDNGETTEKLFSYFSLTPYGYANFLPFITAILTCVLLIIAIVILFKDYEKLKKVFKILSAVAFGVAVASFAFANFTAVAALIALMLAFNCFAAWLLYKA